MQIGLNKMAVQQDRGWAIIVAVAVMSLTCIIEVTFKSIAIYYPYMIDYFEQNAENVGFALSTIPVLKNMLGPLAAILMEKWSCRLVTIFSSLLMMSGSFIIYLSTGFTQLIIACILIGFGLSLACFASYYILDVYFQRHFTFITSMFMVVKGIDGIIATTFIQLIVMGYGWKGSFLIITALMYQTLLCATIFRTSKEDTENFQQSDETPTHDTSSLTKWLANIYKLGHFSLFKNGTFKILLIISILQGLVSESIFLNMTDDLKERGATLVVSQSIGTFYGIGTLLGRPFHYICSKFVSDNLLVHLGLCFFIGSLSLLISITFRSIESVFVYILVYSFSNGWLEGVKLLAIKYNIECDDFAFGYAWINVIYGVGACSMPLTGYLRDSTGSYWASGLLFFLFDIVALLIIIFAIYKKRTE